MPPAMTVALVVALAQGVALRALHELAGRDAGAWSELTFLLPASACTIALPLTWYLLRSRLAGRPLALRLGLVGVALAATALWTGWVNGPVGELRPAASGPVFVYATFAILAWFVAMPFLALGLRRMLTADGYVALFDDAWRLAITLASTAVFVALFWGLLLLFVALFNSIEVAWPKDVILQSSFAYPAICVATSFAIGLTDVRPEMFRGLRHLMLLVLRWLTVLVAAIVVLFLGALVVGGLEPLWKTRFAAAGLISLSVAFVTLYNAVYQDGTDLERLPLALVLPVRVALLLGPALAALAYRALALRIGQHGVSEDRLLLLIVVTIVAGFLLGYWVVALLGRRAPFAVRHVNVVMALAIVATLIAVQSPLVDLKRVATASQLTRLAHGATDFDFRYLRFDLGRHGLQALETLGKSDDERVAAPAKQALAEANRTDRGPFGEHAPTELALDRFLMRIEVFPPGRELPPDFATQLLAMHHERPLHCITEGPPCLALLVDLDDDGVDEVVVPLSGVSSTVYAKRGDAWREVGNVVSRFDRKRDLRASLTQDLVRPPAPTRYHGIEIGEDVYVFTPCSRDEPACADAGRHD